VVVRINDRGPLVEGRVLDLSEAAARVLGLLGTGLAQVSFTLIAPEEAASFGSPRPSGPGPGFASKSGPESAPSPTSEPSAGPATGLAAGLAAGRSGGGGAAAVSTQPRAKERLCRIQVAAYKDARNAEATVRRLSLAGLEASLEVAGQFRRVVFPAVAAAEAERLAERLRSLGYRDLLIVWY
jgi:rare lipoprotein A